MRQARIGELKLHLREEADGTGVLVINAQAVLFLDRVARSYFEAFFEEVAQRQGRKSDWGSLVSAKSAGEMVQDAVVKGIRRRFRVHHGTALKDWERLWGSVIAVAEGGLCPFSEFEVKRIDPLSVDLSAPYRCDLILTYRCQNNCSHCYAGGPHETEEMSSDEWKVIIDKISRWGVPTVVFTGGEPLLRPDLEELLQHAQDRGCVTGLITNGRLLTPGRVEALAKGGLDFVQITLESSDEGVHNRMVGAGDGSPAWRETVAGIKSAVPKIYVTTNTTITQDNKDTVLDTVRFLKSLGVRKFGINALIRSGRGVSREGIEPSELKLILEKVIDISSEENLPFIWYTPTCYKEINPVSLGLGVKTCSAASTVLAIEPDGNTMPCQSYYKSLGNALKDEFPVMWQHPLAVALRRRRIPGAPSHPDFPVLPHDCMDCRELPLCGGACPLERKAPGTGCR